MRCQPFEDEVSSPKQTSMQCNQLVPQTGKSPVSHASQVGICTTLPTDASHLAASGMTAPISMTASAECISQKMPGGLHCEDDSIEKSSSVPSCTPGKQSNQFAWMDDSLGDLSISDSPFALPVPASRSHSNYQLQLRDAACPGPPFSSSGLGPGSSSTNLAMTPNCLPPRTCAMTSSVSSHHLQSSSLRSASQIQDILIGHNHRNVPPNIGQNRSNHDRYNHSNNRMLSGRRNILAASGCDLNVPCDTIDSENPFDSSAGPLNQMKSEDVEIDGCQSKRVPEWDSPVAVVEGSGVDVEEGFDNSGDIDDAECLAAIDQLPSTSSRWERFSNDEEQKINPAELHYHGRFSPPSTVKTLASSLPLSKMDELKSEMNFTSSFSGDGSLDSIPASGSSLNKDRYSSSSEHSTFHNAGSFSSRVTIPTPAQSRGHLSPSFMQSSEIDNFVTDEDVPACNRPATSCHGVAKPALTKPFKTPRMTDNSITKVPSHSPYGHDSPACHLYCSTSSVGL